MDEELLGAIQSVASEGADLTAVKEMLGGYVKDPLASIADKESAINFIKGNSVLNSAYDSDISKRVDAYKTRFNSEELPQLKSSIRQEVIKELNPEETEAQKVAREFEEYKQEQKDKETRNAIKAELLSTFDQLKASELGFKTEDLEPYVNQGEKAVENFVKQHERFSAILKTRVEEALKGKFTNDPPQQGDQPNEYNYNKVLEGQKWLND